MRERFENQILNLKKVHQNELKKAQNELNDRLRKDKDSFVVEKEKAVQSIAESYETSMRNMKDEHLIYRDIVNKLHKEKQSMEDVIEAKELELTGKLTDVNESSHNLKRQIERLKKDLKHKDSQIQELQQEQLKSSRHL